MKRIRRHSGVNLRNDKIRNHTYLKQSPIIIFAEMESFIHSTYLFETKNYFI